MRLRIAIIASVAIVVCGAIERGHRVSIRAPSPAEIASRQAAQACPHSDSLPYGETCLTFLGTDRAPDWHQRASSVDPKVRDSSACPDNDNKPYPPSCVQFLSGWFWQADRPQ